MGHKRNPKRDEAFELYRASNKECKLADIADKLGVSKGVLSYWKSEDAWDAKIFSSYQRNNERSTIQECDRKLIQEAEKIKGLTDKQKDFCLHYVKTNNTATAAIRAGYSTPRPAVVGYLLKRKSHIKAEIMRLKAMYALDLMATAEDVVELHMRIAKADMTDFASWGRSTVPVMGSFGPIEVKDPVTGKNRALTKEINEIRFVDSSLLDGQLISEIKVGRDGACIKLVDRQKSLDFLERYFEMNPMDRHKKAYENARLALERARLALEEKKSMPDDEPVTGVLALPSVLQDEGGPSE